MDIKDTNEKSRNDSWYSHPYVEEKVLLPEYQESDAVERRSTFDIKPAVLEEKETLK